MLTIAKVPTRWIKEAAMQRRVADGDQGRLGLKQVAVQGHDDENNDHTNISSGLSLAHVPLNCGTRYVSPCSATPQP